MRELPGRPEIETIAGRAQSLLAETARRRQTRELEALLTELSELVLGPLAGELPRARYLAIVPDGALQTIPFAALPRPDATGRSTGEPLVASHVTVVLPSPSTLAALRRREAERVRKPDKLIAMIADPVFEPDDGRMARQLTLDDPTPSPSGLRRLKQTGKEAGEILEFVPEGLGRAILGFDAVPEVISDPDLQRYRYLHFGTHGVVDAKHPELSGIVLSQFTPDGRTRDGTLNFYDVYDLDLPVDLVSLSTCRSADGPQIRREGPITMTRSFFYAGASRVLGTLWEVSDKPAAELTTAFYEGVLREGKRPSEALRDAQDAMRRKGWPPHTWAAFVLQGDWR
jgi:CHAT domain-containing protein